MADVSKITLPNGSSYNIKDPLARNGNPTSATMTSSGVLIFKNSEGDSLFSVQFPLYQGGVSNA